MTDEELDRARAEEAHKRMFGDTYAFSINRHADEEDVREVSRDDFYKAVGPLNVHPRPERDVTYWETPYRLLVGKSYPGYVPDTLGTKRYFLQTEAGRAALEPRP